MSKRISTVQQLVQEKLIHSDSAEKLERVVEKYSLAITPHLVDLIKSSDPSDGISQQFLPTGHEMAVSKSELEDPIGDTAHSPVPGIIHRYNDRVLLNVLKTCAVYCRFCFRREDVGAGAAGLTKQELASAIDYIRQNTEIWEVILSGGDPLTLSDRRITELLEELGKIPHLGIVRFHTRVPAVAPELITDRKIKALKSGPTPFVVLHVNHPDEMTLTVREAIKRIVGDGIPMLSQTVLLRGVNDNVDTLSRLFKTLLTAAVKPYYLHHGDLARGTKHFRTSVRDGQKIIDELRRDHSGLCQPSYVLDLPGGAGKVPIATAKITTEADGSYRVLDRFGNEHLYEDDCSA